MRNFVFYLAIVSIVSGLDAALLDGRMLDGAGAMAADFARGLTYEVNHVLHRVLGERVAG